MVHYGYYYPYYLSTRRPYFYSPMGYYRPYTYGVRNTIVVPPAAVRAYQPRRVQVHTFPRPWGFYGKASSIY